MHVLAAQGGEVKQAFSLGDADSSYSPCSVLYCRTAGWRLCHGIDILRHDVGTTRVNQGDRNKVLGFVAAVVLPVPGLTRCTCMPYAVVYKLESPCS
jgi:hypothetical protein